MDIPVIGTIVLTLTTGRTDRHMNRNLVNQLVSNWDASARRKVVINPISFHHVRLGPSRRINDNYCVSAQVSRWLTQSKETLQSGETVKVCQTVTNVVNSVVINPAHIVQGLPQRKGLSPAVVRQHQSSKYVNNVCCVDQLCSVKHVPNFQTACRGQTKAVFGNLGNLGARPKVIQMLKEVNPPSPPFHTRLNLTRSPTIISCYVNPHRNNYLLEALHQLMDNNAVKVVKSQESLGFSTDFNFLDLDLRYLNKFLKAVKFKMEPLETIRTSL